MTATDPNGARFPRMAAEFPDFDQASLPADIPEGFEDGSWGVEQCPAFYRERPDGSFLVIFVDFPGADDREFPDGSRFYLYEQAPDGRTRTDLAITDDWQEVLAALPCGENADKALDYAQIRD